MYNTKAIEETLETVMDDGWSKTFKQFSNEEKKSIINDVLKGFNDSGLFILRTKYIICGKSGELKADDFVTLKGYDMKQPTLKQACESLLQVECPLEYGYDTSNLYDIYMSEYGNHWGFTQPAVTEYVRGLPSCFTFPIYNGDILEAITQTGYPMEKHREATKDKIIDLYWQHIGYAVYKYLKQVKKKGV